MTTEILFFALKSKKEKVLDGGQNGFRERHAAFKHDTSPCANSSACASSRAGDCSRNFAVGVLSNGAETPCPIGCSWIWKYNQRHTTSPFNRI